jgi:hypothetical protein
MDATGFLADAAWSAFFWPVAGFLAAGFAAFFLGTGFVRDGIVFLRVTQFGRRHFCIAQIETGATFEQEKTVGN